VYDSALDPMSRSSLGRKRVLVVNCYLDYYRQAIRRPNKFPQAVGPVYLAGAFTRQLCEVRCYDEVSSGPLTDSSLLGWPDMLVLTGLTHCFDRMLHLTAYARSRNQVCVNRVWLLHALNVRTTTYIQWSQSG
jgi:hypothetical protein